MGEADLGSPTGPEPLADEVATGAEEQSNAGDKKRNNRLGQKQRKRAAKQAQTPGPVRQPRPTKSNNLAAAKAYLRAQMQEKSVREEKETAEVEREGQPAGSSGGPEYAAGRVGGTAFACRPPCPGDAPGSQPGAEPYDPWKPSGESP